MNGLLRHLGAGLKSLWSGRSKRVGRFRIVRRLAVGGMAEIFLARAGGSHGFEKLVVVKRILRENAGDERLVRMFLDEARLMATLDHPNITQVHDFGRTRAGYFFAMEYVDGADLRAIQTASARHRGGLPLELSLGVIGDAAAGLHYAHDKRGAHGAPLQIVHRDVSPSNVLVSYDGAVKVTDFGIAKWRDQRRETQHGTLKGKFSYMSPEQCRGEPLDRRSDVFSLGILFYEMITGTQLFQGSSDFAILNQIVTAEIPRPTLRNPGCPAGVERIVLRALEKNPDGRFASAREMQLAVEEASLELKLTLSAARRATHMHALFGPEIAARRDATGPGGAIGEPAAQGGTAEAGPRRSLDLIDGGDGGARPAGKPDGGNETVVDALEQGGSRGGSRAGRMRGARRSRVAAAVALAVLGVGGAAVAVVVGAQPWSSRAARPAAPPAPRHHARAPVPGGEGRVREPIPSTRSAAPRSPAKGGDRSAATRPRAGASVAVPRTPSPDASRSSPSPSPRSSQAPDKRPKIWDPDSVYLP